MRGGSLRRALNAGGERGSCCRNSQCPDVPPAPRHQAPSPTSQPKCTCTCSPRLTPPVLTRTATSAAGYLPQVLSSLRPPWRPPVAPSAPKPTSCGPPRRTAGHVGTMVAVSPFIPMALRWRFPFHADWPIALPGRGSLLDFRGLWCRAKPFHVATILVCPRSAPRVFFGLVQQTGLSIPGGSRTRAIRARWFHFRCQFPAVRPFPRVPGAERAKRQRGGYEDTPANSPGLGFFSSS